jgi:nucleotide-binding universal stress UspA family protein
MTIAHCSEFLTLDDPSFVHAVAIAAGSGAAVRGIHAARDSTRVPAPPPASLLLERWQKPPTAIDHGWVLAAVADDTTDALLDTIGALDPVLLVLNTHARRGITRLFADSIAEAVARNASVPVLLLPAGGPALASSETGAVSLERVILPAGSREDTERAAEGLSTLLKLAAIASCSVELLHVEDGSPMPEAALPSSFDLTHYRSRGPLERAIAERVRDNPPSLLVMTSHGHDQLSDIVLSSHTERVLHECRRPLLWVPARTGGAS